MQEHHPRQHAASNPDGPALILEDRGQRISHQELVENADRAAQLFKRLGLVEGDTIADVAVIGVPNDEFGEEVKAVVQSRQSVVDEVAMAEDILAYVLSVCPGTMAC